MNKHINASLYLMTSLLASTATSVAFAQTSGAPPTWLFVHVPNSGSGRTADQVAQDLDNLLDSLEQQLGPPTRKICIFGYSGQWFQSSPGASPNLAAAAANAVGNASDTDNRESFLLEISYCTAKDVLSDVIASEGCDVVIGLGEGLEDAFVLEQHGSTDACYADCNGGNNGGAGACPGGECGGTDWDEPVPGGGTLAGGCLGGYTGGIPAHVSTSNAGAFLCGWFCCARCCVMEAIEDATTTDPVETPRSGGG